MKYRNTETGVVWTEDEIRKGYTDLRGEMETNWNSFEEYLAFLLRNGDLEETSHTKYEVIWNTTDCCDGFYFEAATEEEAKDLLREIYTNWMTAEQENWKAPEPTPKEIENWNYMISECYCYLIPDDAEDEEDEIWLTDEECKEIGWVEMEEKPVMKYENDTRTLTIEELEKILCDRYGSDDYDRESGCNHNGKWFSIDAILKLVSDKI